MTTTTVRRCGLAATVFAVLSLIMAPLNALARMRTDDGRSDLDNPLAHWWADPALRALDPIVGWGSPDTVYLTYGKFYVFALLGVLVCAFAVHSLRPPGRFAERWGWRLTLTSYCLMSLSLFFTYWIANLDLVFLAVTIPALLLSTVGETMLGIGLIRAGFRPRLTAWVLALSFPLSQVLVMISTQALGMWPTMLAWGTAGWALWRRAPHDETARTAARSIAG
jgi:hypothetical protein